MNSEPIIKITIVKKQKMNVNPKKCNVNPK